MAASRGDFAALLALGGRNFTPDVNAGSVREWARIRVLHEADGNSSGQTYHARPKTRMAPESHRRFCASRVRDSDITRLFVPAGGCNDSSSPSSGIYDPSPDSPDFAPGWPPHAFYGSEGAYLNDPNKWVHVVSADCVVSEQFNAHIELMFQLTTRKHRLAQNAHNNVRVPGDRPVTELEEAASIGPMVYPGLTGHFWNEALVLYYFLDAILPVSIPILWGHTDIKMATGIVHLLRSLGVLRSDRQWISVPSSQSIETRSPSLFRVKRLFFVRASGSRFDMNPPQMTATQRLLNAALGRAVRLHYNRSLGPGDTASSPSPARGGRGLPLAPGWEDDAAYFIPDTTLLRFLLLSRSPPDPAMRGKQDWTLDAPNRHVLNNAEIIRTARRIIPSLIAVDDVTPRGDHLAVADLVSRACLLIGSHGANLGNMLWMRQGCWLVEIGYLESDELLPHTYHGVARNLNSTYWMSVSVNGSKWDYLYGSVSDFEYIFTKCMCSPADQDRHRPRPPAEA